MQAAIIRADLILWADAAQLGQSLWADLRKIAGKLWWPVALSLELRGRVRQLAKSGLEKCTAVLRTLAGNTEHYHGLESVAAAVPQHSSDTVSSGLVEALPDAPRAAELFAPPYRELVAAVGDNIDKAMLPALLSNFGGNREQALTYALIDYYSAVLLERASRFLFGSQIDAIIFLAANNGRAIDDEMRRFYDAATDRYPEIYRNYPFEGWLSFLQNEGLVAREREVVSLLPAGKAIISYMQSRGYLTTRAQG